MNEHYFLEGMWDRHLRELHDEVRREMKSRGLIIYDLEEQKYVTPTVKKPVKKGRRRRSNQDHKLLIDGRNNQNIGKYKQRRKGNPSNSILIDFLCEDWSFLFPNVCNNENRFYVYYHSDPSSDLLTYSQPTLDHGNIKAIFKGVPFYIGKGTGDRFKNMSGRSTSHVSRVKGYIDAGFNQDDVLHVIEDGLTELEAFELESKLITFLGCSSEITSRKKHFNGFNQGLLINADLGKRPNWIDSIIKERFK